MSGVKLNPSKWAEDVVFLARASDWVEWAVCLRKRNVSWAPKGFPTFSHRRSSEWSIRDEKIKCFVIANNEYENMRVIPLNVTSIGGIYNVHRSVDCSEKNRIMAMLQGRGSCLGMTTFWWMWEREHAPCFYVDKVHDWLNKVYLPLQVKLDVGPQHLLGLE